MNSSLRKAYEITDAKIQFVSLVDKAANLRTFLLKKADDGTATFATYGKILKTDPENHHVTGVVYEPLAEDSQGNYMTEAEITKAAYWFAKNSGEVDIQHSFVPFNGAAVVETWVAKADFSIGEEQVKKGTWLMTVEVTDPEIWSAIEKGDITGFSMGGMGTYSEEDVDLDTVTKQQEPGEKKGLLKALAKALGFNMVEKGAMAELYEERSKGTLFWDAFNTLEDVLFKYDPITGRYVYESDEARLRECLEEFDAIITSILTGGESITKALATDRPVEKAGKKMSSKNKETLSGIYESLGAFLKEFDDPEEDPNKKGKESGEADDPDKKTEKEDTDVTKHELEKAVEAAVAKALGNTTPAQQPPEGGEAVTKAQAAPGAAHAAEITQEAIEKMVASAIEKAMQPQQEIITADQVEEMINSAVAKAIDPVLKSRGLPSNLGTGTVEKQEEHFLHGIL